MTYEELLQDTNWITKREQILQRDSFFCQECHNEEIIRISRTAFYIRNIKYFQRFEVYNGKVHLPIDYTLLIQDKQDSSEHQAFVSVAGKPLDHDHSSRYEVYYTNEFNKETSEKKIITYIKDLESKEHGIPIYVRGLHVHHTYYQEGKLPWEYPDDALKTLCWICHNKLHDYGKVNWLDEEGNIKGELTPCDRCCGAGYLPEYKHVQNGVCFKCGGARYFEFFNE
ncbi:MAG: hypothetical protein ISR57_08645 [Bacteroidales bacterium]|nr:hypothetical protein [Bacteroidales bacterium]